MNNNTTRSFKSPEYERRKTVAERNRILLEQIKIQETRWEESASDDERLHIAGPGTAQTLMRLAHSYHFRDRGFSKKEDIAGIPSIIIYSATREEYSASKKLLVEDCRFNERYILPSYFDGDFLHIVEEELADVVVVADPVQYDMRRLITDSDMIEKSKKLELTLKEGQLRKGVIGDFKLQGFDFMLKRHPLDPYLLFDDEAKNVLSKQYDLAVQNRVNKGHVDLLEFIVEHPQGLKGVQMHDVIWLAGQNDKGYLIFNYLDSRVRSKRTEYMEENMNLIDQTKKITGGESSTKRFATGKHFRLSHSKKFNIPKRKVDDLPNQDQ